MSSTSSDFDSPIASTPDRPRLPVPRHAFEMLLFVLKNVDNPANYPVEVRVNVCSFLSQLSKHTSGEDLVKVKTAARPVLENVLANPGAQGKEELLEKAIKRLLEAWS